MPIHATLLPGDVHSVQPLEEQISRYEQSLCFRPAAERNVTLLRNLEGLLVVRVECEQYHRLAELRCSFETAQTTARFPSAELKVARDRLRSGRFRRDWI